SAARPTLARDATQAGRGPLRSRALARGTAERGRWGCSPTNKRTRGTRSADACREASRPSEESSWRIAPGFSSRARSRNEAVPGVLRAFGDTALDEKTLPEL